MSIDLTGDMPSDGEYVFAQRPDNPEMRDSVSFRIFDNEGLIGLPRIGIEAIGASWDTHEVQTNLTFPDGRVFRIWEPAPTRPAINGDGKASILAAGPLSFQCIEPFRTWKATFDGTVTETHVDALIVGPGTGPLVRMAFEIEATMTVPPWQNGQLLDDAAEALKSEAEANVMGGLRYEQLCQVKVALTVDDEEYAFSGNGLRVRRRGERNIDPNFSGGIMQTALFPSGRGFGYQAFPDRADGSKSYNEGYLFLGDGALIPARATQIPWMTRLQPRGEDVSCIIETDAGATTIRGETIMSSFDVALGNFPALQQANVLYTWDGEQAYGMIERVAPRSQVGLA